MHRLRAACAAGLAVALLGGAYGGRPRVPKRPVVVVAPKPPLVTPDSATAQALGQSLGLPAPTLMLLAAHAELLTRAAARSDAEAAYSVTLSADRLAASLYDAVAPRLTELSGPGRQSQTETLTAIAHALPGLGLAFGPTTFDTGIDYAALAQALPDPTPGRDLLTLAGVLRSPTGELGYMRQGTALPCADFRPIVSALGSLPAAWRLAPANLRAQLTPTLRDAIVRMGEQADFCADEAASRQAAHAAAQKLSRLPMLAGPGTAKRIGHNYRSWGLRFGLAPSR